MQTTLDVNISGEDTNDFGEKFNKMTTSIQTVKVQMDVLKQTIKELEKMVKMEQKKNSKNQQKLVNEKISKKRNHLDLQHLQFFQKTYAIFSLWKKQQRCHEQI